VFVYSGWFLFCDDLTENLDKYQ